MILDDFEYDPQSFGADPQRITNLILNLVISNKASMEVILRNQAVIMGTMHPQKSVEQYKVDFKEEYAEVFNELMAAAITEITKGSD